MYNYFLTIATLRTTEKSQLQHVLQLVTSMNHEIFQWFGNWLKKTCSRNKKREKQYFGNGHYKVTGLDWEVWTQLCEKKIKKWHCVQKCSAVISFDLGRGTVWRGRPPGLGNAVGHVQRMGNWSLTKVSVCPATTKDKEARGLWGNISIQLLEMWTFSHWTFCV
jgi:hypothetical protein